MLVKLSVVVPTVGRRGLAFTLDSIRRQEPDPDLCEILVIGDSHVAQVEDGATMYDALNWAHAQADRYEAVYTEVDGGLHCWGQPQRNHGMDIASGAWISFLQDDDVYDATAFEHIRLALVHNVVARPILFRCYLHHGGRSVWDRMGVIAVGHVDANCIVVPNNPEKLKRARWGVRTTPNAMEAKYELDPGYLGDFDFIEQAAKVWGGVAWSSRVIAHARPPYYPMETHNG